MASSARNCGIKNRLRSATSILPSPESLHVYTVGCSKKVSWPPNGDKGDNFPLLENSIDRDYMTFLSNLTVDGNSYLLKMWMGDPKRLVKLKYEEQGKKRSNLDEKFEEKVEDLVMESSTSSTLSSVRDSGISVMTDYQCYIESIKEKEPTFFRDKLIEAISSPFNQSEYEEMVVQAAIRSPQVKLKHLRSDSVPYKTNKLGLSYFDYFPDLAKEIEHADCNKGLALMRGFFFWLKNLGHEGAFRPWFPHL